MRSGEGNGRRGDVVDAGIVGRRGDEATGQTGTGLARGSNPLSFEITTNTYSYLFLVLKHNTFKISLSKFYRQRIIFLNSNIKFVSQYN